MGSRPVPYPAEGALTPKHLGYLHYHHRIPVNEIAAHYPSRLNASLVHLGLHHYLENRAALDAELAAERDFNVGGSLKDSSFSLPAVDLASLANLDDALQAASE